MAHSDYLLQRWRWESWGACAGEAIGPEGALGPLPTRCEDVSFRKCEMNPPSGVETLKPGMTVAASRV